ncbi:MAG: hypothetical protein MI919_24355 [Holophagales bacterium]|nr:hypothetical protein [Holophagales bacterium]
MPSTAVLATLLTLLAVPAPGQTAPSASPPDSPEAEPPPPTRPSSAPT